LFFTNTMGGLVGGWITAFAIIPYSSLRESLVTAGLCLLALALMWAAARRTAILGGAILLIFLAGLGIRFLYEPRREFRDAYGGPLKLIYSHQSGTGLLQVIDHAGSRLQLINGVTQGEMSLRTGRMVHDHVESMSVLAYMHHPQARTALILGLGPGVLAKELDLRGLDVTAVELELRVAELAGKYFYLPANVRVAIEDARTFLREDTHSYDLIFLDAYAGETTAWYLLTFEAMREMKSRLNSGGKLVINNAAWINHKSAGLVRIEATALAVFNHAMVYPDALSGDQTERISNTIIVAGDELSPQTIVPSGAEIPVNLAASLAAKALPAVSGALITTDDRSDLDYVESQLRIRWRGMVWDWMRTNMLGD
jgi:spermidine synthase